KMALIVAAVPMGFFIYGMVRGAFNYQIRRTKLKMNGLPKGFVGLKVLQISDLHLGSFVSQEPIKTAVEMINKEQADLIFFTGDLVNNRSDEAEEFIEILKTVTAPMGVYSILGNHDYGDYVEWPSQDAKRENLQRLVNIHGEMGWKILLNENVILEKDGEKLAVLGVENWGAKMRFPKYGDLKKAYQGTENIRTKLLLSHDPSHWRGEVTKDYKDIDCTFSGHTHGMQFGIEIPGFKWSPVQYVYEEWAGLYQEEEQQIYVNRGLGFLGYMGRVGISPEISVFELDTA
ncbi:MAG: metallophosphoesterase, partial [Flavobacteriales bacterium]|nr:metallophosphoesterase [Flavobacteriales bacterium]